MNSQPHERQIASLDGHSSSCIKPGSKLTMGTTMPGAPVAGSNPWEKSPGSTQQPVLISNTPTGSIYSNPAGIVPRTRILLEDMPNLLCIACSPYTALAMLYDSSHACMSALKHRAKVCNGHFHVGIDKVVMTWQCDGQARRHAWAAK